MAANPKNKRKPAARPVQPRPARTPAADPQLEAARALIAALTPAVMPQGTAVKAPAEAAPAVPQPPAAHARRAAPHPVLAVLSPFGWMAVTDATALLGRLYLDTPGPGGQAAGAAALAFAVAALTRTLIRLRRKRDKATRVPVPLTKAQRRARKRAVKAWAAAVAWSLVTAFISPLGPFGAVQDMLVLGGLLLGAGHLFDRRQQVQPAEQRRALAAAEETPAETDAEPGTPDPRLEVLREFFAGKGAQFAGLELHSFELVPRGFAVQVKGSPAAGSTYQKLSVQALRADIAALFDVPAEQVMTDRGPVRSETRARIVVLTDPEAFSEPQRWNGESTYDPVTGAFEIGGFGDGTPAHWWIHVPRSGMWGGTLYGLTGTGKSGDFHVIAGETGQVVQCTRCGAHREADGRCAGECDPRRKFILLMGDPQKKAFGVWRGNADVVFWGELACVLMTRIVREIGDERTAGAAGSWTDSKGRVRESKGWFDPGPDVPGVLGLIDEWPKVIKSARGGEADENSVAIAMEHRKDGAALVWAAQMPDAGETGNDRVGRDSMKAYNVIAHRLDPTSKHLVGGIKGDARNLPEGPDMWGTGYIGGMDGRSDVPYRTKGIPEDSPDGVDVLDVAEMIRGLPLTLDPAVRRVFGRYGITRGMTVDDAFAAPFFEKKGDGGTGKAAPVPGTGPRPGAPAQSAPGPVSAGVLGAVAAALRSHAEEYKAPAEVYDVMKLTGLNYAPACRALAVLEKEGRAAQAGPGGWSPAAVSTGA